MNLNLFGIVKSKEVKLNLTMDIKCESTPRA